ncbi:MAG: cytidylate kinase-like family protein [Proteobacteria bacterium]|nr:cytidylate kinase-like family protein [Pseudomonadota bacterium]MBU1742634.1 cytidylate kinase-like family protein [Pseudomonadota bacterium]
MAIITISHDSFSHGQEIADKVAQRLGYECIGPEVIQEACEAFNLPQKALKRALHDSPRVLERFLSKKERYIAMFRAAFFERMRHDNVVYHGLAGHVFLAGVPHVFKVRIITHLDDRVREEMRREGITDPGEARRLIERRDAERKGWTRYLYDRDNHDPELYDIYLNLQGIGVDQAVEIIVNAMKISTNGHMPVMRKMLADRALEAKVEARLLEIFPDVQVQVREGEVFARINASIVQEDMVARKARGAVSDIEGVKAVRVGVAPSNYVPF